MNISFHQSCHDLMTSHLGKCSINKYLFDVCFSFSESNKNSYFDKICFFMLRLARLFIKIKSKIIDK